ncbi:beta-lactamase family protein [Streptomyces sp. NBC_01788]|nr:beta-lactamase family protein [Streptomyces sp. NBC_01788]
MSIRPAPVAVRLETPRGTVTARAGVGDLVTHRPVPKDGYLRLGSITKTFVATVMMQLVGDHAHSCTPEHVQPLSNGSSSNPCPAAAATSGTGGAASDMSSEQRQPWTVDALSPSPRTAAPRTRGPPPVRKTRCATSSTTPCAAHLKAGGGACQPRPCSRLYSSV